MKTFRFIGFALFAILMCLSACSSGGDDPIEPTPKPEVTKSEITIDSSIISNGLSFSNVGGDQSISFTTNENWTLSVASTTSGTTWCTASVTSGTKGSATVKFTVTENTEYENRSVSVTIKSGTASKTFTITQKSADALLVTTDKYEVGQEGGSIEIEVKANIDYKMEISENAKDWIKESSSRALTAYKHKLDIAMNEDVEKREGEITFKSGDKVETVKVYQAGGAIILLSQNEYTLSDAGETISVEIKSNVEFGVQMPDVDWIIDDSSSRGMSSHTLKYAVAPNEGYDNRSAEIIFYDKNSDLKDTLKVVQAQKGAIIVSEKWIRLNSESDTIEVKLSANVDFEIEIPEVSWIKQLPSSRSLTEYKIKFSVSANDGEKNRKAHIIFKNTKEELSDTLEVIQRSNYGYFEFRDYNHNYAYIELYKAGTLEKTLELNTTELEANNIVELKVVGPINGNDIHALHYKEYVLDISEATIVEGEYYYWYESSPNTITSRKVLNANNTIGDNMFYKAYLTGITLPQNAISIGEDAFMKCYQLTNVNIGDNVTSIEDSAFRDCKKLWKVIIGNGVISIGSGCFYGCSSLSSITIPENVTSIGNGCFLGSSLTSIVIPNNVIKMGVAAFEVCENLTSATIGDGITSIEEETFAECKRLKKIILGKNVKTIGEYAFKNTTSLNECYSYNHEPPGIYKNANGSILGFSFLGSNAKNAVLYVPKGCVDVYKNSKFGNCFKNIVEMD